MVSLATLIYRSQYRCRSRCVKAQLTFEAKLQQCLNYSNLIINRKPRLTDIQTGLTLICDSLRPNKRAKNRLKMQIIGVKYAWVISFVGKDRFSRLREQWMIRRTKAIIAHQLPKKDEKVVYCKPTPFQVRKQLPLYNIERHSMRIRFNSIITVAMPTMYSHLLFLVSNENEIKLNV